MRLLILLLLLCPGIIEIKAQAALSWAHQFGNTETTRTHAVVVDSEGNVYSVGTFLGTVDFNPGPGVTNLTSAGDLDVFVSKLDAAGNFVWAKRLGGTDEDYGNAIALDPEGNVYIVGYFYGIADFDPNAGTTNLMSSGDADIFICKLDNNGILMWAAKAGGLDDDEGTSVGVDSNGDVLFGGFFNDLANFNPGPAVTTMMSAGGQDAFITKLDAGGIFVWAKRFGGTGDDAIHDLTVDIEDHVISTGRFSGSVDFDPGPGISNLSSSGMKDAFVSRLDVSGNFIWARKFGGGSNDEGLGIHTDTGDNVYATGYFNATVDFDPGPDTDFLTSAGMEDIFVSKLNSNGDYGWSRRLGSTGVDQAQDITTDQNGDVYTTGFFSESVDFDPGNGTALLTSFGTFNTFISRLTSTGDFVFASELAGDDEVSALTIAVDTAFNIYCGGVFKSNVDFDPGLNGYVLTASGMPDAFIVKLKPCLPSSVDLEVMACESYVSPSGNFTWTESGTYQDKIANASGCDSLMTIHLTIDHQSESELTVSACDAYQSPSGKVWTTSGIYVDTISNAAGCDSLMVINLTVYSVDTTVIYVENYSLTAQMAGATYQWLDCNNGNQLIPEATEQSYYPVASGSYAVIISANNCSDTSSCHNIIIAGTKDAGFENSLDLHPNPAKDYILVEMNDGYHSGWLSILDVNGHALYRIPYHGQQELRIDLNLASGIYLVSVKDAEKCAVRKMVVQ